LGEVGFGGDAEGVGDAVDVVEIRDDLHGVMYRHIIPAGGAERIQIIFIRCRRIIRQTFSEIEHRRDRTGDTACPPVVDKVIHEGVGIGAIIDLGPEVFRVRL
jgi:hypothetical protein